MQGGETNEGGFTAAPLRGFPPATPNPFSPR